MLIYSTSSDFFHFLLKEQANSYLPQPDPPKLLARVRMVMRRQHYSIRTEQAYVQWIKRFIHFHKMRHPQEMDTPEIELFLNHLAAQPVAASTQNQAFSALLFLYGQVLNKPLSAKIDALRAKTPRRLPTILSKNETLALLQALPPFYQLEARLLYGAGLRLMEALRLRVKDVDFAQQQIIVRSGKGNKDRITVLPEALQSPLQQHLQKVKILHQRDLARGYGRVYLPEALARKYPRANQEWGWQYVFPAHNLSVDPRTGQVRRHHLDESGLRKAIKQAAREVGLNKPVGPHTLRHCFASHLLQDGYDIRTIQELMGHKSVETTMIYTHVLNRGGRGVRSPLDV